MTALLSDPQTWLAFATLAVLEIVLGVDNIIFISIMVSKLPQARQRSARITGLALAMCTRIALLYSIVWLTRLTRPLIDLGSQELSGRDLILLGGGLFLLAKSVIEIHHALEGAARGKQPRLLAGFLATVIQIAIVDIVFSLDSVFVAVGLAKDLAIMVAAIVAAILVMMWVAGSIGDFVDRHPTIKMLALAFLILIGATLVAEALHYEMPKKYLYFAMAFAAAVELINLRLRALMQSGKGTDPKA
jgi:predicted tellurium resistance membrane protein TerC